MDDPFNLIELQKIFTDLPFNRMLGLEMNSIQDAQIIMGFAMKPELIGNFVHGILHGGVISSVIDMAGGAVAMTALVKKHQQKTESELKALLGKASTINLHINYIRPGLGRYFTATSKIIRSGNKISFTHTDLHNEKNVLIATGAGTYLIG